MRDAGPDQARNSAYEIAPLTGWYCVTADVVGDALLVVVGLCATRTAQPPAISHTVPGCAIRGQGERHRLLWWQILPAPTGIWWNMPAEAAITPGLEKNGTEPGQVPHLSPSHRPCRWASMGCGWPPAAAFRTLRLVMVDDLPSITKIGTNKSLPRCKKSPRPWPSTARASPELRLYRINGVAGQRITVEVVARRLGYPLDPVIRLLDATGRESAYSDDAPGLGCRLSLCLYPADRWHVLSRISRHSLSRRGTHRYRLRVGNFPLATTTYPAAGAAAAGQSCKSPAIPATKSRR